MIDSIRQMTAVLHTVVGRMSNRWTFDFSFNSIQQVTETSQHQTVATLESKHARQTTVWNIHIWNSQHLSQDITHIRNVKKLQSHPRVVAQWSSGRTLDLRSIGREFNSHRAKLHNNLGQVVDTHVSLSPSSKTWYWSQDGDILQLGLAECNGSLPPNFHSRSQSKFVLKWNFEKHYFLSPHALTSSHTNTCDSR